MCSEYLTLCNVRPLTWPTADACYCFCLDVMYLCKAMPRFHLPQPTLPPLSESKGDRGRSFANRLAALLLLFLDKIESHELIWEIDNLEICEFDSLGISELGKLGNL